MFFPRFFFNHYKSNYFFKDSEEYIITLFSSQSEKITARENTKEEIVFFQKIFCFHVMQYIPRSRLKKSDAPSLPYVLPKKTAETKQMTYFLVSSPNFFRGVNQCYVFSMACHKS